MKRWIPTFLMLLAGLAQVGALLPLAQVLGHLLPKGGPAGPTWALPLPGGALSPVTLLLVWLGGWAISRQRKGLQVPLTLLLLAGGVGLVWLSLPYETRPLHTFFPVLLLPVLVGAWWGGGFFGASGLYWHSALEGLRRSLWLCGVGLLALWVAPPVTGPFAGPLLLFGAGLTLLFMLRMGAETIPLRIAAVALAPLLLVGLVALLIHPSVVGVAFGLVQRVVAPVIELIAIPMGYLVLFIHRFILFFAGERKPAEPPPEQETAEGPPQLEALPPGASDAVMQLSGTFLLILGVVAVWLLVRWLANRQQERPDDEDLDEVRSGPGVLKGLLGDLQALLGGARPVPVEGDPLPPGHPRRLLRRLQAWGARHGRQRGAAETPAQYTRSLARQLPRGAEPSALHSLADAYGESRYGSGTPSPESLAAAERLLAELEGAEARK